jgi:hypothetical protein
MNSSDYAQTTRLVEPNVDAVAASASLNRKRFLDQTGLH